MLEDAPETGLTGDGVIVQTGPDSAFEDGTERRVSPRTIDVAEPGGTPIGVRSLDGGGVVVVTAHDNQPSVRIRQYIENPPGLFSEFGDGTDRSGLGDSELRITSQGATWGGEVVIPPSASNPDAARPVVTSDPPFGVFSTMEITRPAQDDQPARSWTLDIEIDLDAPPGSGGPQVEPFGDGALATFTNSTSPLSESALVVLDRDGGGVAYDLDGWSVADVRPEGALLARSTPVGLELATFAPASIDAVGVSSIESPSNLFVTAPGDGGAAIDVRNAVEVVEHLSLDGTAAVRSAGRGADGVLYAHLDDRGGADRTLVAIDAGQATVLETKVSGFRLSDDGRFLAVSFSDPPAGETARFEISNLVDQSKIGFDTPYVNAGPAPGHPMVAS